MGYKRQALAGLSYMGGLRVLTRAISYGKIAILARLLTPEQFGLFGIASLVMAFLEIITETGVNVFLIQEKGDIKGYINTAWAVSICRGAVIALFIALTSPLVASFFQNSNSTNLILLISVIPLIRAFINPAVVTLQRDLKFKSEFCLRTVIFLVETIVSITFAFYLKNASSLIYGLIAAAALEVIITQIFIKPRPRFELDFEKVKKVIKRGKWITIAGTSNYFVEHLDDTLVGRLVGTSALGIYQMAYKISLLPLTEISQVVSMVTFPVYVKIADDKQRLKSAFAKTSLATTILATAFGIFLYVSAPIVVNILLGEKWQEVTPLLKVLAIFGIFRAISSVQFTLFNSLKKQRLVATSLFIEFFALLIIIVPFITKFGTIGAAYAALFASIVPLPFIARASYQILKN